MEPQTPTAIGSLFSVVSDVISKIIELLATVCTALMSNPLFQITLGVVVFGIVLGIVFRLVKKIKRRG